MPSLSKELSGLSTAWKAGRWDQWWNYKLPPLWMSIYAVYLHSETAAASRPWLWVGLCLIAAGLGVMAHLLNDWSDRKDDAIAGKYNRLSAVSTAAKYGLLFSSIVATISGYWMAEAGFAGLLITAAILLVFGLYSLPPFRLKGRGWLGGFADATAVHALPLLFCLHCATTGEWREIPVSMVFWFVTWYAWGLRGFLSHQLKDLQFDLNSGLKTSVSGKKAELKAERIALLLFSLELIGLFLFILWMKEPLLWMALLFYGATAWSRFRFSGVRFVLARTGLRSSLLLQECYEVWLPLMMVLALALKNPLDFFLLAFHMLLFARRISKITNQNLKAVISILKVAGRTFLKYRRNFSS